MAYATVEDLQKRMTRILDDHEQEVASAFLDDVAVLIDGFNKDALEEAKKVVSCRVVIRALGNGETDIPFGATQGTMSAMGYSQSFTMGNGAAVGEIYLSRSDKQILGGGSRIGSHSPVEDMIGGA